VFVRRFDRGVLGSGRDLTMRRRKIDPLHKSMEFNLNRLDRRQP